MQNVTQTLQASALFIGGVAGQVIGASLLPKTNGFFDPKWTPISLASFVISLWMVALLIRKGFALSIVIPLMSAIVPLTVSLIAMGFEGEAASVPKVLLLVFACTMVGVAGFVS